MTRILICIAALALAGCGMAPQRSARVEETPVQAGTTADAEPRRTPASLKEAPLERADLRIQRSGWIRVDGGEEMKDSARLRRMAPDFDATVMAFSDRSVTLKMPSARLELLLETIEKTEGWKLDEFDFSAWDRTGEYYSVEARIESAKLVKERLLKLLEAAATLEDVLKIHGKLEEIQKQLDALEGTLREVQLNAGRVDVVVMYD